MGPREPGSPVGAVGAGRTAGRSGVTTVGVEVMVFT
jgi:hypothetical protein